MPGPFSTPDDILVSDPGEISYCGLIPGLYTARVIDAAGNTVLDTVEVLSPAAVGLSILDTVPSCFGLSDGSIRIQVNVAGNMIVDPVAAGYTFDWGHTSLNTDYLTGLAGGSFYSVTVTTPTGCELMPASFPFGDASRINVLPMDPALAVIDATCSGSLDGSITINAIGGNTSVSGGYTFDWSNSQTATGTMVTLNNLDPGNYTVTVTDDNGCEEFATFSVSADKILSVNAVVQDVLCFGDDNGSIFATGVTTFNIPGGIPDLPYTFVWSAPAPPPATTTPTTTEIDGLAPGAYTLTMTDDAGCTIDTTFNITEPALLEVPLLSTTNETCAVGADGTATVTVTGGVFPYSYAWSHSGTELDSIADGLVAGTNYMVTITDANNCEVIETYDITSPIPPQVITLNDDFLTCPDATDGELTVVAVNGSAPIASYSWADQNGDPIALGPNTTTITNLSPGTYYVTITATDDCFTVDSAQVLSPGFVVLDSIGLTLPTCVGENNGRIQLFPVGGTAPYTYTWSTNPNEPGTINPLTSLGAGTYTVTVTDANGCTPLIETIVLPDPPTISGSFISLTPVSCPDDVTCNGAATFEANYSDGSPGSFNFVWSNGVTETGLTSSTVDMLCRGPISVDVSDGQCGVTFTDTIQSPEEIVIGVEIDRVSCFGLSDGEITLSPTGGTAPFDFLWLQSGGIDNVEDELSAGTYTALVTDDNGCARQQVVEVTEPDELVLAINNIETTAEVSCAGDDDGIVSVFVSSSNNNPLLASPYTWSGGIADPASSVATDLLPGTYSVTITDTKGCMDEISYTIGEPTPIVFSVLPIEEPLCFGETTLVLIDTAFGGQSSTFDDFSFSVNNDGFRIPVTQPGTAFAGQTVVTVFDTVGCSVSDTFSVNQPPQILVDLPESILIELGDSLTVLNPIISPAGDVYDYLWTPAEFLSSDSVRAPTIFPFESTDYTFQVTNQNGCVAFADIFVEVDANRNVYIPNVFSPNRDGRNEDFRIYACQGVQSVNFVQIFDRWGGQIFTADNLEPNCLDGIQLWDGEYRGKPVNSGVFVYMVEVTFLDGKTLLYRGDISVLR
jgi:gliding motility-associated-like protein